MNTTNIHQTEEQEQNELALKGALQLLWACAEDSELREEILNALHSQAQRASHNDDKDALNLFADYARNWYID